MRQMWSTSIPFVNRESWIPKEAEVAGDMDESLMLREEVKDSDVQKCDQVTRRVSEILRICLLMRLVYKVLA